MSSLALLLASCLFGGRAARNLLSLLLISALLSAAAYSQEEGSPRATRLWSRDLIPTTGVRPIEHFWEDRQQAGIAFLDDNRLIAHHVDTDTGQLSSRVSPDISSPFRLRAAVLDVLNGSVVTTREWGTRAIGTDVLVLDGGVMVRTGDSVRLLTRDLDEVRRLPLPTPPIRNEEREMHDWDIQVSASRRSVLFNNYHLDYDQKLNLGRYSVVESKHLDLKDAWNDQPSLLNHRYSFSDGTIAYVKQVHNRDRVFASELGGNKWRSIWQHPGESCHFSSVFALITDNSFVLACKDFWFVSGGSVAMHERFNSGDEALRDKHSVAKGGRFVAISLHQFRVGESPAKDQLTKLKLVIYDLVLKKRVLTIAISPLPNYFYDFALSPDGSMIAILNDENVSVYQLRRSVERLKAEADVP